MRPFDEYPEAYVAYLAEYHGSRDFFECHEIMEEYWKEQAGTRHSICWLALIRLAVGCYHARRGNWAGAVKMLSKAEGEIDAELFAELGLDGALLAERVRARLSEWSADTKPDYAPLELPIADPELLRLCMRRCEREGWTWQAPNAAVDPELIHRHTRRDRSEVVAARARSAEEKANRKR